MDKKAKRDLFAIIGAISSVISIIGGLTKVLENKASVYELSLLASFFGIPIGGITLFFCLMGFMLLVVGGMTGKILRGEPIVEDDQFKDAVSILGLLFVGSAIVPIGIFLIAMVQPDGVLRILWGMTGINSGLRVLGLVVFLIYIGVALRAVPRVVDEIKRNGFWG